MSHSVILAGVNYLSCMYMYIYIYININIMRSCDTVIQ